VVPNSGTGESRENGEREAEARGRMHVVIAGGGVAGLEAVLALSALAKGLVDVELVSPTDEFVYRPMLVAEPFGNADVLRIELEHIVGDAGARHTKDALVSVDPGARAVTTASGDTLRYDALLIALGANPVEAVPGALTFSGEEERKRFAGLLSTLGRRGMRRLAFVVPRAAAWSIAAYELALLTAAEREARRLEGVEIMLVTHEAAPLHLFGPAASQLVAARLEEAGISARLSSPVDRFDDGQLRPAAGEPLAADAAVALPALEVPPLPGLPQREHGFVQTDAVMRVDGLEAVWAAGDATRFPIKQGGLAAQQADVAARSIAARAGAHVPIETFQPILRGALITGGAPDFVRSSRADRGADAAVVGRELWSPATKVAAEYLGPYVARARGEGSPQEFADLEPSADPAADEAAHQRAVSLVLAAADADARIGDFEGALKWLSLVEQLNLVIPPEYVARRYEWRRQLQPDLAPDAAAERIDPSFASAAAAISDLWRRVGWLGEIEHRTEGEMRDHLSALDEGMDDLIALSRRAGILEGPGTRGREDPAA
jgi:sulfide:quinone oxidoreductase